MVKEEVADLHSKIDILLQTAIVTKVAIRSPHGRIFYKSRTREYEVDHFQRLHPAASSCSNGYQSLIEHLLATPDTLILGDFNAQHQSWYQSIQEEEKWPTQLADLTMVFSTGTAPQEFRQMLNRVRQMSH